MKLETGFFVLMGKWTQWAEGEANENEKQFGWHLAGAVCLSGNDYAHLSLKLKHQHRLDSIEANLEVEHFQQCLDNIEDTEQCSPYMECWGYWNNTEKPSYSQNKTVSR